MKKFLGFVFSALACAQVWSMTASANPFEYTWQQLAPGVWGAIFSQDSMSQAYQPNDDVDAVQVSGGVYMLRSNSKVGNPSVAASIGEDGVLLVDSGFAAFGNKLLAKIKALRGGKVRFIINTHWHGDHTEGNEFFGPEATIIARSGVRQRLLTKVPLKPHSRHLI